MKKALSVIIVLALSCIIITPALATDYSSLLDGMTLDELRDLQKQVEDRIGVEELIEELQGIVDRNAKQIEELQDAVDEAETKANEGAAATKDLGMWTLDRYVDEFKQYTDEWYIKAKNNIEGTFSNTATNDSELSVRWLIDKKDVALMLFQYGKYQVKTSGNYERKYNIYMLAPDGEKFTLHGTLYTDRIYVGIGDKQKVLDTFSKNGPVTFRIVEEDNPTTNYFFQYEHILFLQRI